MDDRVLNVLSAKVQKLTAKCKEISDKNVKLNVEIDFLRLENKTNATKAAEYVLLKKNVENSIVKVERILRKIETFKK
ncbi:MAG: hypothetical protein LBV16_02455 [Elusimicrobiota bacterium]|nr:hypothetical protein [Elusimicrobiota bacterium]